jgi:hypothetical protein
MPPADGADANFPLVPVPSMRPSMSRRNTEMMFHGALEDEDGGGAGDDGQIEMLAERIAMGRTPSTRRRALRRHETAP